MLYILKSLRWRLWPFGLSVLLIINVVGVRIYFNHRPPIHPLDNHQKLNHMPIVDAAYVANLLSHSTAINHDERGVVSSLYTESYAPAIVTLGHSLTAVNVSARMILIYIPERLSSRTLCLVSAAGWTLHAVPRIPPPHNGKHLWSHYEDQYTKLNLWTLDAIGIKAVVYLDADTLARKNFDELFILPFNFAAVPDVWLNWRGFTILFNAGVMFLRPSTAIFLDMLSKLETANFPLWNAEQDFLNLYYGAQVWRLPYSYNGNLAIKKRNPELWETLVEDMRIIHYTLEKPCPLAWLEHQDLEAFFAERRNVSEGFWEEEMGWWQDSYREATRVLQGPLLHCV